MLPHRLQRILAPVLIAVVLVTGPARAAWERDMWISLPWLKFEGD